jgi:hypothetical protein
MIAIGLKPLWDPDFMDFPSSEKFADEKTPAKL